MVVMLRPLDCPAACQVRIVSLAKTCSIPGQACAANEIVVERLDAVYTGKNDSPHEISPAALLGDHAAKTTRQRSAALVLFFT